jgi:thioredoxin 1
MAVVHSVASLDAMRPLIAKDQLTVVDAFAQWCPPCKAIAPQMHELAMRKPHVQFVSVDVDVAKDIAMEYQIRAMPTFLFFQSGKMVHRFEGADIRRLEQMVDELGRVPAGDSSTPPIPDDATLEHMKPKELLHLMAQHSIPSVGLAEKHELVEALQGSRG